MDTVLCPYRLKSARRKKRLQREDRDKQLLRMEKEYERLRKLKKELPYVPLEKPYQKGWKRLWVLKPEVAKSEKARFYQEILDKLTEVQYHYDRSFKKPKRKGNWHRYYFDRLPELRTISIYKWQAHWYKLTDEQMECFEKVKRWNEAYSCWEDRFEFAETDLLVIAIQPHMIEKRKLHDEELEQKLAFVEDKLYERPHVHRLWKIEGGKYKNWYSKAFPEKLKYKNPLKNRPLSAILDEHSYLDDLMPVVKDPKWNSYGLLRVSGPSAQRKKAPDGGRLFRYEKNPFSSRCSVLAR